MLSRTLETTLHAALQHAAGLRHEYATLEHLLLALLDDAEAAQLLAACHAEPEPLRAALTGFLREDLAGLVLQEASEPKVTAGFQRVVQRAAIAGQSAGRAEITGADVLAAMFSETASHAASFLQQQGLTEKTAKAALGDEAGGAAVVFVAVPPGAEAAAIRRDGIAPAIREAGHQAAPGEAADLAAGITGPVMAEIRRARLVIADVTQPDRGVDFVLGMALGAGTPAIVTCRADTATGWPAGDVRQQDMLLWRGAADLAAQLAPRIAGILGAGPPQAGDTAEDTAEGETLDRLTAALRGLVAAGSERGHVTYAELERALPFAEVNSEMIEDALAVLQGLGIEILDTDPEDPGR